MNTAVTNRNTRTETIHHNHQLFNTLLIVVACPTIGIAGTPFPHSLII
jgi:hypothetical protein